jgi:hypothetical protein
MQCVKLSGIIPPSGKDTTFGVGHLVRIATKNWGIRESQGEEGTIARHPSEIQVSKTANKKREDELKPTREASGVQGKELGPLKDENKAMKAKEDRRMEEVGKCKEEIRQMAVQQNSLVKEPAEVKDLLSKSQRANVMTAPPNRARQFPSSMKKGKLYDDGGEEGDIIYDIPNTIIMHLERARQQSCCSNSQLVREEFTQK